MAVLLTNDGTGVDESVSISVRYMTIKRRPQHLASILLRSASSCILAAALDNVSALRCCVSVVWCCVSSFWNARANSALSMTPSLFTSSWAHTQLTYANSQTIRKNQVTRLLTFLEPLTSYTLTNSIGNFEMSRKLESNKTQ